MDKENPKKREKFQHLQREVDGLLQGFEYESYYLEDSSGNKIELSHINVDDVMNGRSEERIVERPRRSVVEKARIQERKSLSARNAMIHPMYSAQDQAFIKKTHHVVLEKNNQHEPVILSEKKHYKILGFVKSILKYLKF